MRRSPTSISNMTHLQHQDRLVAMIARGGPVHACSECQQRNRRDDRAAVTLKSWSHGWRITCPLCGSRVQDVDGGETYPPADAFEHLWDEARHGEETIANIDTLPVDRAAFVMALLHLLLLRDRAPERIPNGKSWVAECLIASSRALTTSTSELRSPSTPERRSWSRESVRKTDGVDLFLVATMLERRDFKGCRRKTLPIFVSGADHAFQASFERQTPYSSSAPSGDKLARI